MMDHKRTIVVSGAAKGIGLEIAKAFADQKEMVYMLDVDTAKGKEEAAALNEKGYNVIFKTCNVGHLAEVENVMKEIYNESGRIDVLINNAGKSKFTSIWDVTEDEWDDVLSSNLSSIFFCSREAAKYMKSGSIVNMSSTRAFMSEPDTEAYSATKGGIIALTHSLAVTLSENGITVNAISPGWIETEAYEELREIDHAQHLSHRVGKPSDIARACIFLTDPKNTFITGENLIIDGGMTRKMIYEH
ncbi:SDR family NAD(P)-dependent oxidoreductase [Jeotgalibacillus soli]|uniref:3-ketoacyl-ACP reductase n=1 Tax=Jeotgalibacillus soli TaxID=889306 RepID=A0A0C2RVV0_9BACL|nr:SDR family oxidoreductase [Jeotgalibacillus soli]KIL45884.1 3-ketoacyl-ACP reductase [Jeotgalibacillus soli]